MEGVILRTEAVGYVTIVMSKRNKLFAVDVMRGSTSIIIGEWGTKNHALTKFSAAAKAAKAVYKLMDHKPTVIIRRTSDKS